MWAGEFGPVVKVLRSETLNGGDPLGVTELCSTNKCNGKAQKDVRGLTYYVELTGTLSFEGALKFTLKGKDCAKNGGLEIEVFVKLDHEGTKPGGARELTILFTPTAP